MQASDGRPETIDAKLWALVALEEYKKKRDFAKTPEPGPEVRSSPSARSFVIQKHDATRLHYDFRLELDGVMLSWAVPKGPSLDPGEKRLAVHVEDHPLEYSDFEGVIPEGEYGAGTVVVWDRGEWIPESDAKTAYQKGRMSFRLEGDKLKGSFSLFRLSKRKGEKDDTWLLVKKKDEHAKPLAQGDILETRPESVISGRTLEEVAEKKERTWHSNKSHGRDPVELELPSGAKSAAFPKQFNPTQPTKVKSPPKGADWVYEIELEGYRAAAFIKGGEVHLRAERGEDLAPKMEKLATAFLELGAKSAVIDGEVVVFTESGTTSVEALERALEQGQTRALAYCAFDLLYLDGQDLKAIPLEERKAVLAKLIAPLGKSHPIRYSQHLEGDGEKILAGAAGLGVQGIIAKKKTAKYAGKKTKDWQAIDCHPSQEAKAPRPPKKSTTIKLTNPDRVLFEDPPITKQQLADYYETIGDWMLPHIKNRPLMIVRCPQGMNKPSFYQKHPMKGAPAAIKSVEIIEGGETNETMYVDTKDGLVALAQISALEVHTWGTKIDHLEQPDLLVLDLDPDEKLPFAKVREGALAVRNLLQELKLTSFVKTTGGKGLHVVVPIIPGLPWDTTKNITGFLATELVRRAPDKYLAEMTKAKRVGKIFIDFLRNGRGATFVAPYSTRKRKRATIAMPITWDELDTIERADQFTIATIEDRMRSVGRDPWAEMFTVKQTVKLPG